MTPPDANPADDEARLAPSVEDIRLLRGPEGSTGDLVRSLRIWRECSRGFWALRGIGPSAIHRRSWSFMDDIPWTGARRYLRPDPDAPPSLFD